jgi:hypothetical protein
VERLSIREWLFRREGGRCSSEGHFVTLEMGLGHIMGVDCYESLELCWVGCLDTLDIGLGHTMKLG